MKLQILVPQWHEDDSVIKPLLDSIAIQQNVDLENEVEVIITNDNSDVKLTEEFLKGYPFSILYLQGPGGGVSSARNTCLKAATADYVMFCDADDMFFNACGLWIIFREIAAGQFDALSSTFVEEIRYDNGKKLEYVNREKDTTFVHGKVYRRQYLIDNNITWNENLTIHEDSYFNLQAIKFTDKHKYLPSPFYLWKYREDSVCRKDPYYLMKTYHNLVESCEAVVKQFVKHNRLNLAKQIAAAMIYDGYYMFNKPMWLDEKNIEYRKQNLKEYGQFYKTHKKYIDGLDEVVKKRVMKERKQLALNQGVLIEQYSFNEILREIGSLA